MRLEQEIFDELEKLCASPGFAHVISYFCFRDHMIGYGEELKAEDFATRRPPMERLIRSELSTLVGLMLRAPRDLTLPNSKRMQELIERTEALLAELHEVLGTPMKAGMIAALAGDPGSENVEPFASAAVMQEPIFYSADSAFSSQYRDFAVQKYARDNDWLQQHKGFAPAEAKQVVAAINALLNVNLMATLKSLKGTPPDKWTFLGGFEFSAYEIAKKSALPLETVNAVIAAFSFSENGNPTFRSLHEFNAANACPIIRGNGDKYLLFLPVSLTEALYDSPFYWMAADAEYAETTLKNRGLFTEEFTAGRLEHVFGTDNVFRNVDIWDSRARKRRLGEIDVLVLIADRAIVVQAKSKKLTLLARKGSDLQLQTDFKAAVQDAYDQALSCSQLLLAGKSFLVDGSGREIPVPKQINHIHPLCVVSDHYPALSFQAGQFLKVKTTDEIHPPLVCDVFLIDVITEFLDTPLRCLSYLELRAKAGDNVLLSHEISALGFHLKQNLWLGEYDFMVLEDDFSTDLDVAMAVRRDGVPGKGTPPGILTHLKGTPLGRIIEEIERRSELSAIEVGLELLKLSGKSSNDLNLAIKKNRRGSKRR